MKRISRTLRLTRRQWALGLLLLILLLIAAGLWARWRPARRLDVGAPMSGEFRLATWNVGYFTPAKNKNVRDFDISRIVHVLKRVSAHVVVLQELNSKEQADAIARRLGKQWRAHTTKTGLHDQVLVVLSNLAAGAVEIKEAGGRKMIGVQLYDGDGHGVFIVGLHSPHPARGSRETIESIRGAVSMAAGVKEPIRIIAGDFNYDFDEDDESEGGDPLYGEITAFLSDSAVSIGETYYAHLRIDHVFHYPKELTVMKERSGMVDLSFRAAKAPGFRDHRPVVVSYDTGAYFKSL